MSYAVIKTGGKQYRVQQGDKIDVEKLDAEVGATTTLSEVLMLSDGSNIKLGDPLVEGASVEAKVLDQYRARKILAFKFKRRKGYHRTVGHRRHLTKLEIQAINS